MDFARRIAGGCNEGLAQKELASVVTNPTLTEALEYRKARLEKELQDVNNVLEALKKQPGIEELLNLIQKIS